MADNGGRIDDVYPIVIEGMFTNYGRLRVEKECLSIEKRSFFRYKPWLDIPFTNIEMLSLEKPHLVLRDQNRRRIAVTFLNPTPLEEVLARLKAGIAGSPEASQKVAVPSPHEQLAPPMGFLGWALSGGLVVGQKPGSLFGSIGAALFFIGVISTIGEINSESSTQGALILTAIISLILSIVCLRAGYVKYRSAHERAVNEVMKLAGKEADEGE